MLRHRPSSFRRSLFPAPTRRHWWINPNTIKNQTPQSAATTSVLNLYRTRKRISESRICRKNWTAAQCKPTYARHHVEEEINQKQPFLCRFFTHPRRFSAHHFREKPVGRVVHFAFFPQLDVEGFPQPGSRCTSALFLERAVEFSKPSRKGLMNTNIRTVANAGKLTTRRKEA